MILARLTIVLALLVLGTTPALAQGRRVTEGTLLWKTCLLYTSDAADD